MNSRFSLCFCRVGFAFWVITQTVIDQIVLAVLDRDDHGI